MFAVSFRDRAGLHLAQSILRAMGMSSVGLSGVDYGLVLPGLYWSLGHRGESAERRQYGIDLCLGRVPVSSDCLEYVKSARSDCPEDVVASRCLIEKGPTRYHSAVIKKTPTTFGMFPCYITSNHLVFFEVSIITRTLSKPPSLSIFSATGTLNPNVPRPAPSLVERLHAIQRHVEKAN